MLSPSPMDPRCNCGGCPECGYHDAPERADLPPVEQAEDDLGCCDGSDMGDLFAPVPPTCAGVPVVSGRRERELATAHAIEHMTGRSDLWFAAWRQDCAVSS